MARTRKAVGIASLCLLALGLNWLVVKEDLFVASVFIPLGLGLLLGFVWLVLRLIDAVSTGVGAHGLNAVVGTLAWLGICITLFALVRRWDVSWDLTQEGRRELAPQTQQVLENLREDVTVTCFFVRAGGDVRVDVAQDKAERFLARCQTFTDRLHVEYVDPQVSPEKVKSLGVLRIQSSVGTVVLQCGARQREIPMSDVMARLEERDFTNALINVVRDAQPKVYFLTGHGERDVDDADPKVGGSYFKLWLTQESYEVARHLVAYSKPQIPGDCSVLVINGYEADLRPHEIQALDDYLDQGGRLLILSNPQIAVQGRQPTVEQLRPWLQKRFGVVVGSDLIVSRATEGYQIMLIRDFNDDASLGQYAGSVEPNHLFRGSFNSQHPITRGLDQTLLLSAARTVGLDRYLPDDVTGTVLLRSTPDTWAELGLESLFEGTSPVPDPDEAPGPNPVAVATTMRTTVPIGDGGKMREARVVVVGDADLTSNEQMNYVSNQSFLLNTVAWLTENEELIAVRATRKQDPPILLSQREKRAVAWIASLGPVQLIALAGLCTFLIRRKYR